MEKLPGCFPWSLNVIYVVVFNYCGCQISSNCTSALLRDSQLFFFPTKTWWAWRWISQVSTSLHQRTSCTLITPACRQRTCFRSRTVRSPWNSKRNYIDLLYLDCFWPPYFTVNVTTSWLFCNQKSNLWCHHDILIKSDTFYHPFDNQKSRKLISSESSVDWCMWRMELFPN